MDCNEVEELLGAYALNALTDAEMSGVRAHLQTCEEHRTRAEELVAVAVRLAALADPRDAPRGLRSRVLGAIAAEGATSDRQQAVRPLASTPSGGDSRAPVPWGAAPGRVLTFPVYRFAALAAAVLIVIGGLLVWNLTLLGGNGDVASRTTAIAPLSSTTGDATGSVVYFDAEKQAVVFAEHLAQIGPSKTYQLWAIAGGKPESIGLMRPDSSGNGKMVVPFDASRTGRLAVTVEPAGGSPQPTTQPVLIANCVVVGAPGCAG